MRQSPIREAANQSNFGTHETDLRFKIVVAPVFSKPPRTGAIPMKTSVATSKPRPLFRLGNLYLTPGAIEVLGKSHQGVTELLRRHVTGDWGDLGCRRQADESGRPGVRGSHLFRLRPREGRKVWVITRPIGLRRPSCCLPSIDQVQNIADEARGGLDEFLFRTDVDEEAFREYALKTTRPSPGRSVKSLSVLPG